MTSRAERKALTILLLAVLLPLITASKPAILLDRTTYSLDENVQIYITNQYVGNSVLHVRDDTQLYRYAGAEAVVTFRPRRTGNHSITVIDKRTMRVVQTTSFSVSPGIIKIPNRTASIGEPINISVQINPTHTYELSIKAPDTTYTFTGRPDPTTSFVPRIQGKHTIILYEADTLRTFSKDFFASNGQQPTNQTPTTIISLDNLLKRPPPGMQHRRRITGSPLHVRDSRRRTMATRIRLYHKNRTYYDSDLNNSFEPGMYDVELRPSLKRFGRVRLRDTVVNGTLEFRMERVQKRLRIHNKDAVESFAIDPSSVNFTNGTVEKTAAGTYLWKCKQWEFSTQTCLGTWEKLMPLTPGENYTIEIGTDDPGFSETNITVINVQSYPTVGGFWKVEFNTTGQANLTITAINGTTWSSTNASHDLQFRNITCGGILQNTSWVNDSAIVYGYTCNATGVETSTVWTTGKHTLQFSFGDDVAYAYNNATGLTITENLNISLVEPSASVLVSGVLNWTNGTPVAGETVNIYLNGTLQTSSSGTFTDTNEADFANGTLLNTTEKNQTGNVTLNPDNSGTYPNITGEFTSQVFDAGSSVTWSTLSWSEGNPYGEEPPIDNGNEDREGGVNMSGTVLYLRLNEESANTAPGGTDFEDFSSDNNHGTAFGNPTYNITGKFNRGIDLDGGGDYISITPANITDTKFTISFWATLRTNDKVLFGNTNDGSTLGAYFFNGEIQMEPDNSNQAAKADTGLGNTFTDWHHFIVRRNGDGNNVDFFVDGVKKTTVYTGGISNNPVTIDRIGRYPPDTGFDWDGKLDEIIFFNRSITDDEVASLYRRGVLKLNITVRSCNDSACNGESWNETYTTGNTTHNLTVTDNQYFQYKVRFLTNDTGLSPVLKDVSLAYSGNGAVTDANGKYNYTLTAPGTAGTYPVDVNVTHGTTNTSNTTNLTVQIDNVAPVITNVQNHSITESSAIINWTTNESTNASVDYGTTTDLGTKVSNTTFSTTNTVQLSSLSSETLYYYNVTSCDNQGNCNTTGPQNFTTLTDTTAPVITNVQNHSISNNSVSINWSTNEAANGTVDYGTTLDLGSTQDNVSFLTTQEINLTGLQNGTTYYYNITSCDNQGNCNTTGPQNFTTLASGFSILSVTILPTTAHTNDTLSCSFTIVGSTTRKANITWFKDGTSITTDDQTNIPFQNNAANTTNATGDIEPGDTHNSQVWTCQVTTFDDGKTLSKNGTITISNHTARVVENASIGKGSGEQITFTANFSKQGGFGIPGLPDDLGRLLWNSSDFDSGNKTRAVSSMDIDGIGLSDDFVVGAAGKVHGYYGNGTKSWTMSLSNPTLAFPQKFQVYDFNSDGRDEALYAPTSNCDGSYNVTIINGTGTGIFTRSFSGIGCYLSTFTQLDLEGDGKRDDFVVIDSNQKIYAFNHSGSSWVNVWNATGASFTFTGEIRSVDITGEGIEDVIRSNEGSGSNGKIHAYNGSDGTSLWSSTNGLTEQPDTLTNLDLNHDGIADEFVAASNGDFKTYDKNGININTKSVGADFVYEVEEFDQDLDGYEDDFLLAHHPLNAGPTNVSAFNNDSTLQWTRQLTTSTLEVYALKTIDIDDDGIEEVVVGGSTGEVYVLDRKGNLLWSFSIGQGSIGTNAGDGGAISSIDVNRDGVNEFIVASTNGYVHVFQGSQCTATFSDGSYNMTWNAATQLWEYNRTFSTNGRKPYNITCSRGGYETVLVEDSVNVGNISPVISDVGNHSMTNVSAVINWTTDVSANGTVDYGTTLDLGSTQDNTTFSTSHEVGLTGLSQNTLYYYNVTSCDNLGNCNTTGPQNFTTLATVQDSGPPTIDNVTSVSPVTLNAGTTKTVLINFTASDPDGTGNFDNSSALVNFTNGSVSRTGGCTPNTWDSDTIQYNCSVLLQYYDTAGVWGINVSVSDKDLNNASNATTTLTVNTLVSIGVPPSYGFGSLSPGTTTAGADNPFVVENNGNTHFSTINITGYTLTLGTASIAVGNVTMNSTDNTGTRLVNATPVILENSSLPVENDSVVTNRSIYFYITVPQVTTAGIYSALQNWEVTAYG